MRSLAAILFLLSCLPSFGFADPATECDGSNQLEIGSCVADTLQRVDATVDIYLGFTSNSWTMAMPMAFNEPSKNSTQQQIEKRPVAGM